MPTIGNAEISGLTGNNPVSSLGGFIGGADNLGAGLGALFNFFGEEDKQDSQTALLNQAKTVDLTNVSPELKALLAGLLPQSANLFQSALKPFDPNVSDSQQRSILAAGEKAGRGADIGIVNALQRAGSFNSTAGAQVRQGAVDSAILDNLLKFKESNRQDFVSQLLQLQPFLQLGGLDKGSVQKGVNSVQSPNQAESGGKSSDIFGSILGIGKSLLGFF